jgi:2-phosphoglycerate kinase
MVALQDPDSSERLAGHAHGSYKPILLIGGASGTGKSTLANLVLARLDLDHRIGTGFIRAVLQAEASEVTEPQLFSTTFGADDPVGRVVWQARRLRAAVASCVDRARREGTSLVIEGSHLLPSVYADLAVDAFAVLAAPPATEHVLRIGGHRHTRRLVGADDVRRIREIDELYRREAEALGVPVLSADAGLDELVEAVVAMAGR